jgi:hypothetical protein
MIDVPHWAIGVGVIILAMSLARVLRVLGPRGGDRTIGQSAPDAQIAGVREALDDVQRRLGEVEERLDFAERMLAKPRDPERGAPPPQ